MPRRAFLAILCVLGVVAEVYALAFQSYGHVAAQGPHRVLLKQIGAGVPVVQVFTMEADGFDAIDVELWSSAPASLTIEARISSVQGEAMMELHRVSIAIRDLAGGRAQRIAFPLIQASAGQVFAVQIRATDVRGEHGGDTPEVALVASLDRPLRRSVLLVGDQERWGSLVFSARAAEGTALSRFRLRALPRLAGPFHRIGAIWVLIVLYNALLAVFAVACWSSSNTPAPISVADQSVVGPSVRAIAAAVALVVLIAGSVWIARAEHGAIDLIDEMYAARFQSTMNLRGGFDVFNAEVGFDSMRSIFAQATSRIAWTLTLPRDAHFRAALALDKGAWDVGGDGVVFRVSVERGGQSTELLLRHVNPRHFAGDRRWIPVNLDLSRFAGEPVTLILETLASEPGRPQDGSYDWALWGHPRVVTGAAAIVP